MSNELIGILGVGVSLAGLMWKLNASITQISERVARLEGQMQILVTAITANGGMVLRTNVKEQEEGD